MSPKHFLVLLLTVVVLTTSSLAQCRPPIKPPRGPPYEELFDLLEKDDEVPKPFSEGHKALVLLGKPPKGKGEKPPLENEKPHGHCPGNPNVGDAKESPKPP